MTKLTMLNYQVDRLNDQLTWLNDQVDLVK